MSIESYIRGFLADKLHVGQDEVVAWDWRATPARAWSEVTIEEFDCYVKVTLADGTAKPLYMNEGETCEFLNGFPMKGVDEGAVSRN